jgi:hypothetical protein
MPSTFSTNANLELMADGEDSTTWGDKTNANLTLLDNIVGQLWATATTTGTSTAYAISYANDPGTLVQGHAFAFFTHTACGDAPSLAVQGAAAHPLQRQDGTSFRSGELPQGGPFIAFAVFSGGVQTAWSVVGDPEANKIPVGQCRLSVTSTTVLTLSPYNGNRVTFPSGDTCIIGSSGITAGNTGATCYINGTNASTLSSSTLYYAYLWKNGSGVFVIDFSTTGHATDSSTGIEIKNGDSTRVLVGMIYTNASHQLIDSQVSRTCANWFGRRTRDLAGASGTVSGGQINPTFGSLVGGTVTVPQFLTWNDEAVRVRLVGSMLSPAGGNVFAAINLDSSANTSSPTSAKENAAVSGGLTVQTPITIEYTATLSEGLHTAYPFGAVTLGSGSWTVQVIGNIRA